MENTPVEHSARHVLPAVLAVELRAARRRRGLGLREAARKIDITAGYLTLLEQGKRCPSVEVADDLIAALALPRGIALRLLDVARPGVGHSRSPSHPPRVAA